MTTLSKDELARLCAASARETAADRARRYRRGRRRLIDELGGRCAWCGRRSRLEFDHLEPRDWQPEKTARWVRLARYRREAAAGKVQLLCRSCNARKGRPEELPCSTVTTACRRR